MTKLAVIYYSATGHGTKMAQEVARVAEEAGAEVRVRHIAEITDPAVFAGNPAWSGNYEATKDLPAATADDIEWADAVIFGAPTRFSNVPASFQAFIDTLGGSWAQGKLANKVYAAWTSSQTLHGGQETTLQKIYQVIMHFGGLIVTPGYTDGSKFVDGNPYGVSHVTGPENQNELSEATLTALGHMTKRVVEFAGKLV
ncbi:MAG: NAD(P)H:quinone oxidoreductase [Propionibacteriaceae bacterium]|nr:NAD(P)H:quinone oxidoreductase [Propionibacteriaceae bacterium]